MARTRPMRPDARAPAPSGCVVQARAPRAGSRVPRCPAKRRVRRARRAHQPAARRVGRSLASTPSLDPASTTPTVVIPARVRPRQHGSDTRATDGSGARRDPARVAGHGVRAHPGSRAAAARIAGRLRHRASGCGRRVPARLRARGVAIGTDAGGSGPTRASTSWMGALLPSPVSARSECPGRDGHPSAVISAAPRGLRRPARGLCHRPAAVSPRPAACLRSFGHSPCGSLSRVYAASAPPSVPRDRALHRIPDPPSVSLRISVSDAVPAATCTGHLRRWPSPTRAAGAIICRAPSVCCDDGRARTQSLSVRLRAYVLGTPAVAALTALLCVNLWFFSTTGLLAISHSHRTVFFLRPPAIPCPLCVHCS
jgi:hypothetical protein